LQGVIQNLILGIQAGAVYALIAVGYTMVYGVLRLINFAHGDVYMVGAFVGLTLSHRFGVRFSESPVGFTVIFILTLTISALLGMLIERAAYRPLRRAPRLTALITAIGVSLLLEALAMLIWGTAPQFFRTEFPLPTLRALGLEFNLKYLVILGAGVVLMTALWWVVTHTRVGKAMRAVSHDPEAAALMGINTDRIISYTFALGSALAAAAGLMVSAILNVKVDALAGVMPGLKAFVAAVLGGIGNIPGAVIGGLVMGVAETFVQASPYSTWTDAIAFVLLILILIFKPAGIMGRAVTEKV
jgi:branched-chain amino acid transport system permease protein